jgi:hypothetical protein
VKRTLAVLVTGILVWAAAPATSQGGGEPERLGQWSEPFAELDVFAKRPPKDIEESLKIPPAVSMAMLPDGRVIYWGGLEGIESGTAPVAADGGRAIIESRVRLLDLKGADPRWTTPRRSAPAPRWSLIGRRWNDLGH